MTETISGLYIAIGLAMVAQCVVRFRRREYLRAALALVWTSLMWRIATRFLVTIGGYDLGVAGRLALNEKVIAAQLSLVLIAVMFVLIVDWEDGRG